MDTDCDKKTGQCTCKEGYIGKDCDKCAPGYKKTYDADDNLMCERKYNTLKLWLTLC